MDALRLVGHGDAGAAGREPALEGLLELSGVEERPRGDDLAVRGPRLGIAGVQPRPEPLQLRNGEAVVGVGKRKGSPPGHVRFLGALRKER